MTGVDVKMTFALLLNINCACAETVVAEQRGAITQRKQRTNERTPICGCFYSVVGILQCILGNTV